MTALGRDGASTGVAPPLVWARDMRLRHLKPVREADIMITMGSTYGFQLGRWRPSTHATFDDCTVAQSPIAPSRARTRWQARQRELYESADLCLAASNWTADSIEHDYGIPRRKIHVTGLGANISCAQTEKDWSEPRILWVGVDWDRKGGDLLLEAFARAGIPGATLDLVGQHPPISRANVRCHGLVRDEARLRMFYERATLFVLPSRFEAFGMVFIEAASAGTPCLGSDVGGIPDAIGPAGTTFPAGDVHALTQGLIAMTDPSVAAKYVAPALAHAEANRWPAVAQRVIDAAGDRLAASRSTW